MHFLLRPQEHSPVNELPFFRMFSESPPKCLSLNNECYKLAFLVLYQLGSSGQRKAISRFWNYRYLYVCLKSQIASKSVLEIQIITSHETTPVKGSPFGSLEQLSVKTELLSGFTILTLTKGTVMIWEEDPFQQGFEDHIHQ